MKARRRRAGALTAWVILFGAAGAALQLAGAPLPSPPLRSPERWSAWLAGRDAVVVAFSVLRLLALGFAWYALAVTVAGALARLLAAAELVAALDRVTLPPLRRVLAATISVGIGTASLGPVAAGAAARPTAVVAAQVSTTTTTTPPAPDTLTMRELPPPSEAPRAVAEPRVERTWTVRPGECFWSIAEDVLGEAIGRRATVAEVLPYWRSLVETNRDALADRENADLVFPGQVFTLPDPT
jgi:nucleoid-associated protein YgaU